VIINTDSSHHQQHHHHHAPLQLPRHESPSLGGGEKASKTKLGARQWRNARVFCENRLNNRWHSMNESDESDAFKNNKT